jgi:hypothetical protein
MSEVRGDDRDRPPAIEARQTDEALCSSDAVDAERDGWVDSVRRDRPVLYAARLLIKPLVQLVVAILGIGALLRALLPRIDVNVEWLESWGREHLSWVPDPLGWAARWLGDRFGEMQIADWIGTVLRNAKWWVPILLAVVAGVGEVLRRWEAASAPVDPPPPDGDAADEDGGVSDAEGVADAQCQDGERGGPS